jgi:hypothetical protein
MVRNAWSVCSVALLVLLSGCAADNPLLGVSEEVAKVAGALIIGNGANTSARGQRSTPMVSTRKVSSDNPGRLYSGYMRDGAGDQFLVLLTLHDGIYSHVSYPQVHCASNLRALPSYLAGQNSKAKVFDEFLYFDTHKRCGASERVEVTSLNHGAYRLRTYSRGRISSEGILQPAVVPVPDAMEGVWEAKGQQWGARARIRVRLAQNGLSYTEFEQHGCESRSRLAFQDSEQYLVAGYHEPTECDAGGYVVYELTNRQAITRTAYAPGGETTSQITLKKVD